jgi:hypothetical protein
MHKQTGPVDPNHVALPDSLVADGIPPIPKAIAEAVGAYSEARSASVLGLAPARAALLVSTRFADTPQVHEVRGPGGARRQLTFFADKIASRGYPPAGDGGFFVYSKDIGGNEFAQNWRLERATGSRAADRRRLEELARPVVERRRATGVHLDPADPQGHRPLHRRPARAPSDRKLSPRSRAAAGRRSTGRRTTALLVMNYVSVNESYLWRFDVATGRATLLTEKTDPPVPGAAGRSRPTAAR